MRRKESRVGRGREIQERTLAGYLTLPHWFYVGANASGGLDSRVFLFLASVWVKNLFDLHNILSSKKM